MDWSDSPDQAAFRAELRRFVAARLPQRYREYDEDASEDRGAGIWLSDRKSAEPERQRAAREWAQALASKGWVAPAWPREYGGAGLSIFEQYIFKQEMAATGAPPVGGVHAVEMLGPTLILHGDEPQRTAHMPRILAGEESWAQGYSEPGAGSDLASLQTRAVRDGDDYIVNGQKIWTSAAHHADWLFALVRTDQAAPKHRGISFLMMDIHTPGITLRPIVDMGFEYHFNETFFEDVRVPAHQRVGEENRGWYVGMTLLDLERSGIIQTVGMRKAIERIVEHVRSEEGRARTRFAALPQLRAELAERAIEVEVTGNFGLRITHMQNGGLVPNYESSVAKLFLSETQQRLANTGMKAFGLHSTLWDAADPRAPLQAHFTKDYVRTVPTTIYSGTSEIQRNIIATRGLGLPRG